MFILRLYFRLLRILVIDLPLTLIGAILLLLILPYYKRLQLPSFLRWFDCADIYPEMQRDSSTYLALWLTGKWYNRYVWLAFRNPLNYFSYKYYAFKYTKPELISINTQTAINEDRPGYMYCEYKVNGEYYWEYRLYKYLTKSYYLRFRLGWKLGIPSETAEGELVQDVFVCQIKKNKDL